MSVCVGRRGVCEGRVRGRRHISCEARPDTATGACGCEGKRAVWVRGMVMISARSAWGARAVIMHAGVCSRWGAVWRGVGVDTCSCGPKTESRLSGGGHGARGYGVVGVSELNSVSESPRRAWWFWIVSRETGAYGGGFVRAVSLHCSRWCRGSLGG